MNLLTGAENPTIEQVRDEVRTVTIDDMHAIALEAMDSALLMVPDGHSADWAGFVAAPVWSAAAGA